MEPNFTRSFVSSSLDEVIAPSAVFSIELTQIINRTAPLEGDGSSRYSGIWLSSFKVEEDQLFLGESRYTYYQRTFTNISVIIDRSLFYVNNVQEPIARQTEVIFHSLLFTNVVLELFGLLFLLNKLIIIPAFEKILAHIQHKLSKNQVHTINEDLTTVVVDRTKTVNILKRAELLKSHRQSPRSMSIPRNN